MQISNKILIVVIAVIGLYCVEIEWWIGKWSRT